MVLHLVLLSSRHTNLITPCKRVHVFLLDCPKIVPAIALMNFSSAWRETNTAWSLKEVGQLVISRSSIRCVGSNQVVSFLCNPLLTFATKILENVLTLI